MVCPNCKSKELVSIQDQQFCINCGQMVGQSAMKVAGKTGTLKAPVLKVQSNGLPEGVKITSDAAQKLSTLTPDAQEVVTVIPAGAPSLIRARQRLSIGQDEAPALKPQKKRKPGRPKAGRLDIPKRATKTVAPSTALAVAEPEPAPSEPLLTETPLEAVTIPTRAAAPAMPPLQASPPANMSDIRRPAKPKPQAPPAHHVHRVGVAPLHFGSLLSFSLKARFKHHHIAIAALAASLLGGATGVGVWLMAAGKLPALAQAIIAKSPTLIVEALLLAVLYYIGRSIGQAAIVYGVAREADGRPVSLGIQLGAAVNTFGRRLGLDLIFGAAQLSVMAAIVLLIITGGMSWNFNPQVQIATLFGAFLFLLYLSSAISLSRGLANVALILSKDRPAAAAKLGWELFSHRLELISLRFVALGLELVLALPLGLAAIGLILTMPADMQWLASLIVGALAWFVGAVMGAGTATWWAALYRKIIELDHPGAVATLVAGRQPSESNRLTLTLLTVTTGFTLAAALMWPFLKY